MNKKHLSTKEKDFQEYIKKMDKMNKCINNKCKNTQQKLNTVRMEIMEERENIRKDMLAKNISKQNAFKLMSDSKNKIYKTKEKRDHVKCQLQKCYQQTYNFETINASHHKNPENITKIVKKYISKFKKSGITIEDLINYEKDVNNAI